MTRIIIFVSLLFSACNVQSSISTQLSTQGRSLNQKIIATEVTDCNYTNSILINSFRGFIAIPNIYYAIAKPLNKDVLLFHKNRFIKNNDRGSIMFGNYNSKEPEYINKPYAKHELYEVLRRKKDSFNIIIQKIMNLPITDMYITSIYRDGYYMQIVDYKPYDWEAVLRTFYFSKDNKCLK